MPPEAEATEMEMLEVRQARSQILTSTFTELAAEALGPEVQLLHRLEVREELADLTQAKDLPLLGEVAPRPASEQMLQMQFMSGAIPAEAAVPARLHLQPQTGLEETEETSSRVPEHSRAQSIIMPVVQEEPSLELLRQLEFKSMEEMFCLEQLEAEAVLM